MNRALVILGFLALVIILLAAGLSNRRDTSPALKELRERYTTRPRPGVQHSAFPQLKGPFVRPQEVTLACIGCHTERHKEVLASSHWNWERIEYIPEKGIRRIGKKDILNNYCIGVAGNLASCGKCHAGYGYLDARFDFSKAENIDCLVCHDNSATYDRGGNGLPRPGVNLAMAAQSVGKPLRTNCGNCHFFGGGGNNVKHGDLEEALFAPSRDIDVHMAVDGANLLCTDCHTTRNHQMKGKLYSVSSMNRNRSSCEQCHGSLPHGDNILNEHTVKVACQSCHIPRYAKVHPTKLTWDWSTAGRLENGKPIKQTDAWGNVVYSSQKGDFTYGKNLIPEYLWFNGTASHHLTDDTLPEPLDTLLLNPFYGNYRDPDAKIIPVKIHRGKQIYDKKLRILIPPKLYSEKQGEGAFWKDFDWHAAAREGLKQIGKTYSGEYDFVKTEMNWPVNHMVAPAAQSVSCEECHRRTGSRLANLTDFYLPGRDRSPWVEIPGKLLVWLSLILASIHGSVRLYLHLRRQSKKGGNT